MKSLRSVLLFIFIVVMLCACGSTEESSSGISLNQATDDVQAIYKSTCINCHAADLSGKMGDATNLQQVYERLTYDEVYDTIMNGRDTMPAFKDRLSDDEISILAAWLANQ